MQVAIFKCASTKFCRSSKTRFLSSRAYFLFKSLYTHVYIYKHLSALFKPFSIAMAYMQSGRIRWKHQDWDANNKLFNNQCAWTNNYESRKEQVCKGVRDRELVSDNDVPGYDRIMSIIFPALALVSIRSRLRCNFDMLKQPGRTAPLSHVRRTFFYLIYVCPVHLQLVSCQPSTLTPWGGYSFDICRAENSAIPSIEAILSFFYNYASSRIETKTRLIWRFIIFFLFLR